MLQFARVCAVGLLALILAGCAATGPLYETPKPAAAPYATVVLYRVNALAGGAWPHHFWINQKLVAKLPVSSYSVVQVKEGVHEVHTGAQADFKGLLVRVQLVGGNIYYFGKYPEGSRVSTVATMPSGSSITVTSAFSFGQVRPERAELDLAGMRMTDPFLSRID
jgi:hypothetical protein